MRQTNIIGMTLCSGIGAPEMAAPWVDWRFASEIEPFPRAVLQERLGYKTPDQQHQGEPLLWGDMTEVTPDLLRSRGIPLPDMIVAGTPCQAFSVAGARKGLADARGNLTLAFVEICHAIVDARPDGKLAILWENVPGVLSDRGNAFGCFLGGLVGALDALPPPGNGSWPSEGMVQGPRARAAWAVLDAQWFGVAQRRRRVFVVVDFGNCVDPAAVLLEPDRLRGDSPPRREAGEASAASVIKGAAIGRKPENGPQYGETLTDGSCYTLTCNEVHAAVAPTLSARTRGGGGLGTDFDCDGGLIAGLELGNQGSGGNVGWFPPTSPCRTLDRGHPPGVVQVSSTGDVAHRFNAGGMGRQDYETETMVAHALRGEGFDASEDGTGRGTPLVPVSVAMRGRDEGAQIEIGDECAFTLRASTGGGDKPHVFAPVAFDLNQITSKANRSRPDPAVHHTLPATACPPHLATEWAVRRLTPRETARLQGFPDDHTAITYRGKPAADGPQYRAHGNSMAVPVIRWIMDRMRISMEDNA